MFRKSSITLFLILLLALCLRIYNLGNRVVWYDEADSIASSTRTIVFYQDRELAYKPLYFILLKLWIHLFGVSAFWLRMLSVIFGTVSVYFLYLLGREIFEEKLGLLSAFLLAISPFHIYHSQQVRQFTLVTLLAIISLYFFIAYLKYQKFKYGALNFFFSVLLIITYPYGIIFIVSQIIIFCLTSIKHRNFFISIFTIILSLSLITITVRSLSFIREITWWIERPNLLTLKEIFSVFIMGGENYGLGRGSLFKEVYEEFNLLKLTDTAGLLLTIPIFMRGIYLLSKKDLIKKGLIVFFLFTVTLVFAISCFLFNFLIIKHFIIILPIFLLIVSYGMLSLRKELKYSAVFLLIWVSSLSLCAIYVLDLNINWKHPADLIRSLGMQNDTIILATDKEIAPFLYYLRKPEKNILSDINYCGKIENGKYLDTFNEQYYKIVLIKESRSCHYNQLRADFLSKLSMLTSSERIWLLMSRYVSPDDIDFIKTNLTERGFLTWMNISINGVTTILLTKNSYKIARSSFVTSCVRSR